MPNKEMKSDQKDIEENKATAAIGYIWILCFVPLLIKKDSKFAQFHGKQGLVLFILEIVAAIILMIPVIGWVIGWIIFLITIILSVMGLLQALSGNYWEMPVLGAYAKKFNL